MTTMTELWASNDPAIWGKALAPYSTLLDRANVELEHRLENMGTERIGKMSPEEWHAFLRDEYFVWKYTAKNRLTTTRAALDRWVKKARPRRPRQGPPPPAHAGAAHRLRDQVSDRDRRLGSSRRVRPVVARLSGEVRYRRPVRGQRRCVKL
jgi:hypothetical protein